MKIKYLYRTLKQRAFTYATNTMKMKDFKYVIFSPIQTVSFIYMVSIFMMNTRTTFYQ